MKKVIILFLIFSGYVYAQTPWQAKQNLYVYPESTVSRKVIIPKAGIRFPNGSFLDRASSFVWGINRGTSITLKYDSLILKEGTNITFTTLGNELTITSAGGIGDSGGTNTDLSNLTAPVKVNQNLTPDYDNYRYLGNATYRWKGLMVSGLEEDMNGLSFWQSDDYYGRFLIFDDSPLTGVRVYRLPNTSGTMAVAGTSPLSVSNAGVVSMTAANSYTNGYLSMTDWSLFNSKVDSITNLYSGGTLFSMVKPGSKNKVKPIRAGTNITFGGGDTLVINSAVTSGADVNLSNVTSTSIPAALIPDVADTRYLGSESKRWKGLMISGDEGDLDGLSFWQGTYYARLLVYTDVKPLTANRNIYVPDTSGTMLVRTNYPLSDSNGTIYSPFVLYGDNAEIGMGDSVKITDSDCPEYDGYTLVSVTTTLRDGFGSALGITAVINSPVGAPQTVTFRSIANQALGAIFYYQLFYSKD